MPARFLAQSVDHVPGVDVEVGDTRRQAARVEDHAGDADRRLEQVRSNAVDQCPERRVSGDEVAMAIGDDRRIGTVPGEKPLERVADRVDPWIIEIALLVGRRVAGGEQ
jgi:hypothetical protein